MKLFIAAGRRRCSSHTSFQVQENVMFENSYQRTAKPCGCKGIRTCLLCEAQEETVSKPWDKFGHKILFLYCNNCNRAWEYQYIKGHVSSIDSNCSTHKGRFIQLPGITLIPTLLSKSEEAELLRSIDGNEWIESQSGRKKQEYGPKANFKKKRVKLASFNGLPAYSKNLIKRILDVDLMHGFIPVELCNLEYTPERGSAIDPHFDDFWLWGDRVVSINLAAETILTFTPDENRVPFITTVMLNDKDAQSAITCELELANETTTNIAKAESFPENRIESENFSNTDLIVNPNYVDSHIEHMPSSKIEVHVSLKPGSMIIMHSTARYDWKHFIRRRDIAARRVAVTLRELSAEFKAGGSQQDVGRQLEEIASNFNGSVVH